MRSRRDWLVFLGIVAAGVLLAVFTETVLKDVMIREEQSRIEQPSPT